MDNLTANNTLLALLLALRDLDTSLTEQETAELTDISHRLYLEPETWESDIAPSLLSIIQVNPNLNQLYQTAKSQLDSVGDCLPPDLLPTLAELEYVTPETEPRTRGFAPVTDESESDSLEINNIAIDILSQPDPSTTAKKLSSLERLKQFLQKPTVNT
ncbi:MAG: hypothetical protein RIM23_22210 [Coleofasciculus sp. G3-WIS-01]|uniref:hypothetical protein n=1 Tax=Coleofasciculus sp. G3-WIS-01 TaxID=3069528 RepID=UPI0032F7FB18